MRPELLIVLPVVFVVVCWLIRPAWCGWGWELTEGGVGEHAVTGPGLRRSEPVRPSVSSFEYDLPPGWLYPNLPPGWTPEDVELTLMDIEYVEAYRP